MEIAFDVSRPGVGRRQAAAALPLVVALACVYLTLACQSALAQAMYRIKPLGYLGGCTSSAPVAYGFNGSDQVTGQACNANGDMHAFLWSNNGTPMVDLGPSELGSMSIGYGINASGLVGGSAQDSTGYFAFESSGNGAPMTRIYDNSGAKYVAGYAINDLGQLTGQVNADPFIWRNDGSPIHDLGTFDEGAGGAAINASGQIIGTSEEAEGGAQTFIWKNDGSPLLDLGNLGGNHTSACCINASGEVAGSSSISGRDHQHAFLWRPDGSAMEDLGTLGRGSLSNAYALNDSGQVVGESATSFDQKHHAFVWNNGAPMQDLGTLGGTKSRAIDNNALGQVTGWAALAGDSELHAFLWRNDGTKIQDLNLLIDSADPWRPYITLTSGAYINDLGDVLAQGTDSRTGQSGLYLLQGTVLTLSPRSLSFGNQKIKTSSAVKSVTVTNTSAKAVAITSVTLIGSPVGQFAQTNSCGKSLAAHKACAIKVTFKPITKGAKSATLNVNGGGGGLRMVSLAGTGT